MYGGNELGDCSLFMPRWRYGLGFGLGPKRNRLGKLFFRQPSG